MNRFGMVFSSKVNSETVQGQGQTVDHVVVPPDAYAHDVLCRVWNHVDIDVRVKLDVGDFDGVVEEGDSSIAVDDSGLSQAEDVFGRGVGFRQGERLKQAVARFSGFPEADVGDLFGSGVDLAVVVAMDFLLEDGSDVFHFRDVLESTGTSDAIL